MRASRMFAALSAALVAALLSLGGASLVIADQPAGKGGDDHAAQTDQDNGNANGHSQGAADQGTQAPAAAPAPAPSQDKEQGPAKHRSAPRQQGASKPQPALTKHSAPAPATQQGGGSHSTATSGPGNSSQGCDGTHHSDTGHGANQGGPYDNTCDGSPSLNGNGKGEATGKPCAGCVGNADDKNPKGQMPNGSDHNAGYECDRNHGIGRSNPAHTGCTTTGTETPPTQPPVDKECTGDISAGESANCGKDKDQGDTCPKLSSALSAAAVVALKAVAAAHPEIAKLSDVAAVKLTGNCGAKNDNESDNGNGHTPVTVCHREGNGSYHIISPDENSLQAHLDHGDIYPVPAEGCPQGTTGSGNTPGGNTPEQPVTQPQQPVVQTEQPVVTPQNTVLPTTESGHTPAPGQQQVLGVRENGTAPANTPGGRQEVLGERAAGGSAPASAVAPSAAQQAVEAGNEGGSLPFTGTDALLVLFFGCLLVLGGVTLQRVLARE